jgi:hypothetical protein
MYTMTSEDAKAELPSEEVKAAREKSKELNEKEKLEILKELHETPIGGHQGMNRTYNRLKQYVNWEGMKGDVENFIKKCEKCQKNKLTQCHTRMPLTLTDTPSVVFEKCVVDLVGPFSPSQEGNRYILTVQDDLSKFLIAVPLKEQTAEEVA